MDNVLETYCVVGGSRDEPRLMLHFCCKTAGCPFKTVERWALKSHEENCTEAKAEQLSAGINILATGEQIDVNNFHGRLICNR